ncbi:Sec24B protein [Culex quinquefasciatus]|uniref:Sec24B protein n=1 Tax=Culex quinquefasciatus TaxID=7176 RepID=B0W2G7_CULQU|nr:Sec24B protein [Culex quinquefasciatus]|eukprot:XP_001842966.1 Sec24B protein [Culex quinquefasciatus]
MYTPQSPVYNELGLECVVADVSVDLFTMSNPYIDLATIGQISLSVLFRFNLIFRKPISHAAAEERPDQEHLRLIAIDTEMLVRTSTGIRATDFFGHFSILQGLIVEHQFITHPKVAGRSVADAPTRVTTT